ncbi:Membrane transport protein [Vibrio aerogenes CECT 7868]|uniref:Membrane transport protein n=1 Tax=Vibrio aerogenes CECT 7868 TaxID=1216006 RepID=A0A1M6BIC5_9VIBR|nr:AEC family transporter [Vibrio aerogenes]SHI48469.1 Membrane transport protein [Vibrio aerogenes CECT 7868]
MDLLLEQFKFSLSVTGPICLMLFLGVYFRKTSLIDDHFIEVASRLVFKVTLPVLLFLNVLQSDFSAIADSASFVLFGLFSNFIFFLLTTVVIKQWSKNSADQSVIIQGGFRGNAMIVALAYVANAYGNQAIATAALYCAGLVLLFNVEAVYTLIPKNQNNRENALGVIVKTLTKNPLIIAILLGLTFSLLNIPVPEIADKAGHYFANMTLPLALICGGGALDLRQLHRDKSSAWIATLFKLALCPLLITAAALLCGFRGIELGIIFLTSSAPTASASYVMARVMGGNAVLAANIIVLTTFLSLLTTTIGIFALSILNLI